MDIANIDHIVLIVKDIQTTVTFYESVLGMTVEKFGQNRFALKFGNQKMNIHQQGEGGEPKANMPVPGSEDVCFVTSTKLEDAMNHVKSKGIKIIKGPVERTGATGPIVSFYFRDPDNNLIEIANYQ